MSHKVNSASENEDAEEGGECILKRHESVELESFRKESVDPDLAILKLHWERCVESTVVVV